MALKDPLLYDEIAPLDHEKAINRSVLLDQLRRHSSARVAADVEFQWILDDMERLRNRIAENKVSLNEKSRRAESGEDKVREARRNVDRAKLKQPDENVYVITVDDAGTPALQRKPKIAGAAFNENAIRQETLNILADMIEFLPSRDADAGTKK